MTTAFDKNSLFRRWFATGGCCLVIISRKMVPQPCGTVVWDGFPHHVKNLSKAQNLVGELAKKGGSPQDLERGEMKNAHPKMQDIIWRIAKEKRDGKRIKNEK